MEGPRNEGWSNLNNMANKKVNVVKEIEDDNNNNAVAIHPVCGGGKVKLPSVSDNDINEMFEEFWKSYPGPRKIELWKALEMRVGATFGRKETIHL